jgi:hypothetical protein
MSAFVFNVAKGRTIELHNRVDGNDPTNSALILVVLAESGLESDDVLRDMDTLSAVVAGTTNEVTNTNYARKTLTDTNIAAATVDDANDWQYATFSTQTFTSIAAGDSWRKLLVCYDSDTTSGTDANIIPITAHDLLISGAAVVPNGANVIVSVPATGYVLGR